MICAADILLTSLPVNYLTLKSRSNIYHFEISDTFLSDALEILGLRSPVYDWDPPV